MLPERDECLRRCDCCEGAVARSPCCAATACHLLGHCYLPRQEECHRLRVESPEGQVHKEQVQEEVQILVLRRAGRHVLALLLGRTPSVAACRLRTSCADGRRGRPSERADRARSGSRTCWVYVDDAE
eukprot:1167404-Prymnesium_polylepis.1